MKATAKEILAIAFNVAVEAVPAEAAIDNFDPWDSLGHMAVIEAIEAALLRPLSTEEMLTVIDVPAISKLLSENNGANAGSSTD